MQGWLSSVGTRRNVRHESIAAAIQGFDKARTLRVIPERPAKLFDAGGECGIADGDVLPDGTDQILFRNDPPRMAGQEMQDSERLRCHVELA